MRHKAKRLLSLFIIATMMVLPMTGLKPQVFAAQTDQWDLYNFVEDVEVRDSSNQPVNDGVFNYGDSYIFSIRFREFAGTISSGVPGQFAYRGGFLEYQLPSDLKVVSQVTDGKIYIGSTIVGAYTIETSGLVKVNFGSYDKYGNASAQNFIDYTDAAFTLEIEATFTQSAHTGDVSFGADSSITIKQLTYPPPRIGVSKTASGWSGDNRNSETIDYTVTITAPDSNSSAEPKVLENIKLTDVPRITADGMSGGYSYLNFATEKIYSNISYSVEGGPSVDITGDVQWLAPAGGTGSGTDRVRLYYEFPSAVKLNPGEEIVVIYTLDVNKMVEKNGIGGRAPSQYSEFTVNNNVTVTADNAEPGTDDASRNVSKIFIYKDNSVTPSGSSNPASLTWTAWVGDGSEPLTGTITDTLSRSTADASLPLTFPSSGDISVTLYGKPATNGIFTSGVTSVTYTAAQLSGYFSPTDPAGATAFTFTIPGTTAVLPTGVFGEIYRVQFSYTTVVNPLDGDVAGHPSSVTYSNKLDYGALLTTSSEFTATKPTPTPGPGPDYPAKPTVSKATSHIKKNASGDYVIEYTATFTVPGGNTAYPDGYKDMIDPGVYFRDTLTISSGGTIKNVPVDISVALSSSTPNINPEPALLYHVDNNESGSQQHFHIYFGGGTDAETSKWQYSTEKTVIVTYTIPLDTKTTNNSIIGDLLKADSSRYLTNSAAVRDPHRSEWVIARDVYDGWPVHKDVKVNSEDDSVFDYVVTINPGSSRRFSLFNSGAALFADTFDKGLEYVPGSFYIEDITNNRYYGPYAGSPGDAVGAEHPDMFSIALGADDTTIEADFSKLARLNRSVNGSLTINTSPAGTSWYTAGSATFIVRYQLRVTDPNDPDAAGKTYNNTATVNSTTQNCSFSDDASVTYNKGNPLSKKMTADGSNLVEVEIIINPNGRKLGSSDRLTAVDTMNDTLSFYLSRIEIFTKTKSPSNVWSGWTPQPISDTAGELWSIKSNSLHEVEFILPDETPVKIVYTVLVMAEVGETTTLRNEIKVEGYSAVDTIDSYVVTNTTAHASANKIDLRLYKEDEVSNARLSGAGFKLYMAIPRGGAYDGSQTDKITVGGKEFYYLTTAVDKTNGEYLFDSVWITPSHKAVFLIVETASPSGYPLLTAPNNYTFFVIHAMDTADTAALAAELNAVVHFIPDNIHVTNTKPVITDPGQPDPPEPTPPGPTPPGPTPPTTPPDDDDDEDTDTADNNDNDSDENPTTTTPPTNPQPPIIPEHTLIPDGDGWIELDENGVPLGRWGWDPDEEMWIFDDDVPRGSLPQTGSGLPPSLYVLLLGLLSAGLGIALRFGISRRHKRSK